MIRSCVLPPSVDSDESPIGAAGCATATGRAERLPLKPLC